MDKIHQMKGKITVVEGPKLPSKKKKRYEQSKVGAKNLER